MACEVLLKLREAGHLEGEVSEVGLNQDRTTRREMTEFDGFLTFGCLKKDQFGATG